MRNSWLVAGVVAVGLTGGCTDGAPVRQAAQTGPVSARLSSFAGKVNETRNPVGIALQGGRARGFFCDSVDETWFDGEVSGDGAVTLLAPNSKKPVGYFNSRQGSGAFWLGTRFLTFQAAPVDKPAGLYRAQSPNGQIVGGWIVLPGGGQVGAVTNNGVNQTPPNIDPAQGTVTVNGQQLALRYGL